MYTRKAGPSGAARSDYRESKSHVILFKEYLRRSIPPFCT
jgi:hypothetical protein